MTKDDWSSRYPTTRRQRGLEFTLELMAPRHREAVLELARSLPEHDLLFLRRDITNDALLDQWMGEIETGEITTLLATKDGKVLGYSTVHRSLIPWSAHVAELRVLVGETMRDKGLGRLLTHEAFYIAVASGVEKMVAQMTVDQQGAINTFTTLGFRPEALLRDHVKDRNGKSHDLLILGHEVREFEARRAAYGLSETLAHATRD